METRLNGTPKKPIDLSSSGYVKWSKDDKTWLAWTPGVHGAEVFHVVKGFSYVFLFHQLECTQFRKCGHQVSKGPKCFMLRKSFDFAK